MKALHFTHIHIFHWPTLKGHFQLVQAWFVFLCLLLAFIWWLVTIDYMLQNAFQIFTNFSEPSKMINMHPLGW